MDKDDLARQSGNFFGKLRSNFVGTEFQLYDKGINPEKADEGQKAGASSMVQVRHELGTVSSRDPVSHAPLAPLQVRQELGTVLYKQNVLGSRGPRKMKVMVPAVNEAGQRKVLKPMSDEETMLERYKAAENDEDVRILKNKPPKWNDQVGAYVLNFNGRVTRVGQKLPAVRPRARPGHGRDAVWPRRQGRVHDGLPVPAVRAPGLRHRPLLLRLQDRVRVRYRSPRRASLARGGREMKCARN